MSVRIFMITLNTTKLRRWLRTGYPLILYVHIMTATARPYYTESKCSVYVVEDSTESVE